MGRTDQVLTISTAVQKKPIKPGSFTSIMKAVLALLLVCLIQISFGDEKDASGDASSEINLSLQREVREAAKPCKRGDKGCRRNLRKERRRKKKNGRKVRKSKTKKGKKAAKKGGNGARKKSTRKLNGKKKAKDTKKKQKKKTGKDRRNGKKGLNGLRS